jgi:hypothetical protein
MKLALNFTQTGDVSARFIAQMIGARHRLVDVQRATWMTALLIPVPANDDVGADCCATPSRRH